MTDTPEAKPQHERGTTVTGGTRIIGTYEIDKLVSTGGMGEVYRGHNIHNGEPVAIKIVLPSLAHDPKIVALFQKESTVLSRLSHEAIVRYHVFTNDPTIGRPCLVMEFVEGTPVSEHIKIGPMAAADVKVMLRRVASGLEKAHRAGVVHRDLSPDNVILEQDQVEHAKLIDFGIAKSSAIGAGTLLQGQFAGKFNWVAPEQLGLFGNEIDARSDVYSLGLVMAAACRGAVLSMGESIADAVGKRMTVPDLHGVDATMLPLLTWMLQPDPAARPQSMAQVIAGLDDPGLVPKLVAAMEKTVITAVPVVAPTVISAQPFVPPPEDASPFSTAPVVAEVATSVPVAASKSRTGLGIAALALLALAAGGAYLSGAFAPAPAVEEPRVVAVQPAKPAEEVKPAEVANPVKPVEPAKAVDGARPTEPAQPVAVAKPQPLLPETLAPLLRAVADCGPLFLQDAPASGYAEGAKITVAGRVPDEARKAAIAQALGNALAGRTLALEVEVLGPNLCALGAAMSDLPSGGFGFVFHSSGAEVQAYHAGEVPEIDLVIPAGVASGYLYAAVIDETGTVLQLLPSASRTGNAVADLRKGDGDVQVRLSYGLVDQATDPSLLAFRTVQQGLGKVLVVVLHAAQPIAGLSGRTMLPLTDFIAAVKAEPSVQALDRRVLELTP